MRAYVRTSRRTAVSLPVWLAIPAVLLWASVMIVVCLGALVVWVSLQAWHAGHGAWLRRRPAA